MDFVGDVLDALNLEAAVLVGASGGGVWATWYALATRSGSAVWSCWVPCRPCPAAGSRSRCGWWQRRGWATSWCGPCKPGRRMLLRMMASVGEAETIVRHPELLASLVAGARDPVATQANLAELRALIVPA